VNLRSSSRTRVQPLRERLKVAAAEAILDAAEQLFGDHGLDARMEAIAAKAGVAVGTLYNHFADRQALIDALLDARRERLLARLAVVAKDTKGQGFARELEAALEVFAGASGQHARFRKSLLDAGIGAQAKRRRESRLRVQPILKPIFARGVREGVLSPGASPVRGALLMGLFRASFELALDHPEVLPLARVPRVVVEAFLHGAAKRARR
jgi:AcrR family transcriptional regulator